MSDVPLSNPLLFARYKVKIDADNYEAAIEQFEIVPPPASRPTVWHGPIGSDVVDEVPSDESWSINAAFRQDWETATSLSNYLWDHAGETKTIELVPEGGSAKPKFTVDVVLPEVSVGGRTRQAAVTTVTMTCKAKPTRGTTPVG